MTVLPTSLTPALHEQYRSCNAGTRPTMTRRRKSIADAITLDLEVDLEVDLEAPPVPPPVHPYPGVWASRRAGDTTEWCVRGSLPRPAPGSAVWVHARDGSRQMIILGDFHADQDASWLASVKAKKNVVTHPELDWYLRRGLPVARDVLADADVGTPAFQLAQLMLELARLRGVT